MYQHLTEKCKISVQLLVYGAGQVLASTYNVLQPNLKYSVLVGLSSSVQYGRVILVMDKNFCSDSAGNKFMRTENSSFIMHFGEFNCSFFMSYYRSMVCKCSFLLLKVEHQTDSLPKVIIMFCVISSSCKQSDVTIFSGIPFISLIILLETHNNACNLLVKKIMHVIHIHRWYQKNYLNLPFK